MITLPNRRRMARDLARAGALVSAAMLALTTVAALGGGTPASAAPVAGSLQIVTPQGGILTSGTASTPFALRLPAGAACSGDSAVAGFHVDSYLVPASVSPSAVSFNTFGPILPAGATGYSEALSIAGTAWMDVFTAAPVAPSTAGAILLPTTPFDFSDLTFVLAQLNAGDYNVGIACWDTKANAMDKYWNVVVTFTKPTATTLAWTAAAPTTTTTTSTTTTTPGATTTTRPATTTTTTVRSTTTTTTTAVSSGAGLAASGSSGSSGLGGTLVSTGSSPTKLLVWAILLLFFGRIAILLSRPVEVVRYEAR